MKKNHTLALLVGLIAIGLLALSACTVVVTGYAYVTYNGNGASSGTPPVDSTAYTLGDEVVIKDNEGVLTKRGCVFAGWNTRSDGTGDWYYPRGTMPISSYRVILYAQWMPWYEITGIWDLSYKWDTDTQWRSANWYISGSKSDQSDWIFYDNAGASGYWSITANTIELHYQNGVSYLFSFLGTNYMSSDNRFESMRGTMRGKDSYGNDHQGEWSATQSSHVITSMAKSVLESGSITPSGEVVK